MRRWHGKRLWLWAAGGLVTATGLTLAQGGRSEAPPPPPKVGDVITLRFHDGRDRTVKVLKTERQTDGSILSEVRDLKTGEVFNLLDPPVGTLPGKAAATGKGGASNAGRPSLPPPPPTSEARSSSSNRPFFNWFRSGNTGQVTDPAGEEKRPGLLQRIFGGRKKEAERLQPPPLVNIPPTPGSNRLPGRPDETTAPARPLTGGRAPATTTPSTTSPPATFPLAMPPKGGAGSSPGGNGAPVSPEPPRARPAVPPASGSSSSGPATPATPIPNPPAPPKPSSPAANPVSPPAASPALPPIPDVPAVPPPAVPVPPTPGVPVPPPPAASGINPTSAQLPGTPGGSELPPAAARDLQPYVHSLRHAMAPSARALAARALAQSPYGTTPAIQNLLLHACQHDPAPFVRACCIDELSKLGYADPAFLSYLRQACQAHDDEVRLAAELALRKLNTPTGADGEKKNSETKKD
ncbi:MAG: HEAT repeat domain-containing protein [Gemmataceae bacterium]|nr:HEAT repeat domain-containing protein [Gemmataceae bacterium]MDW8242074.1 HEAT repeat domain-containing protein [Thermogemmata sp.]